MKCREWILSQQCTKEWDWERLRVCLCVSGCWMDCVHVLSVNKQHVTSGCSSVVLPLWCLLRRRDWQARTSAAIFLTYDSSWLCLACDECCRRAARHFLSRHQPSPARLLRVRRGAALRWCHEVALLLSRSLFYLFFFLPLVNKRVTAVSRLLTVVDPKNWGIVLLCRSVGIFIYRYICVYVCCSTQNTYKILKLTL